MTRPSEDELEVPDFLKRKIGEPWPPPYTPPVGTATAESIEVKQKEAAVAAFLTQQAEERRIKAGNRIARMKAKTEHAGEVFDTKLGLWHKPGEKPSLRSILGEKSNPQKAERSPAGRQEQPMIEIAQATYASHSTAVRAAVRKLGKTAKAGEDFTVAPATERGRFVFYAGKLPLTGPTGIERQIVTNAPEKAKGTPKPKAGTKTPAKPSKPATTPPKPAGKAPEVSKNIKLEGRATKAAGRVLKAKTEEKPKNAFAAIEEAARHGILPAAPDFSANTHRAYRKALAEVVALVDAGDVAGLKASKIEPKSPTRKMLCRYRDNAILALEAKAKGGRKLLTEITVDEFNADVVKNAVRFTSTKFLGRGQYDTADHKSIGEAKERARKLGQGAMVYAIDAAGRSVLAAGVTK